MMSLSMRHRGDSWPVVWHDTGVSADFLLSLLEWLQSSFFSSIFRKYQCMSCSFFYSLLFSLASGPSTIVSSLTSETPPLQGAFWYQHIVLTWDKTRDCWWLPSYLGCLSTVRGAAFTGRTQKC